MYADHVVLLSEHAQDLQSLPDALSKWCETNQLYANENKSNIVHVRCRSNQVTVRSFNIGTKVAKVASGEYVYLGLPLTEHLDHTMMAKHVSKSAIRALCLVISKFKALGGLQNFMMQ